MKKTSFALISIILLSLLIKSENNSSLRGPLGASAIQESFIALVKKKLDCFTPFAMTPFVSSLNATPTKVIITRHGDKVPNGSCLSLQGLERASAFVPYFSNINEYKNPPITHVFAAYVGGPTPYIRCKQTCKPIADHLKVPFNTTFGPDQVAEAAKEILTNPLYDNASVLLCWEHHNIPNLIVALGAEDPGPWEGDIFDQVYMITFYNDAKPLVQKILQQLMYGDRTAASDTPAPLPEIAVPCPKDF